MDFTYNCFNKFRILAHLDYWKSIAEGIIPSPIFVSLDPVSVCNFNCTYCNAGRALLKPRQYDKDLIDKIIDLLNSWKTRAICLAGCGEPLLNKDIDYLISRLGDIDIPHGLITNGVYLSDHIEAIKSCQFIGVSVDAATKETFGRLKQTDPSNFDKVIGNIEKTRPFVREIGYKFLIHPWNHFEILEAARIAKDIGCDYIHLRPGDDPWFARDDRQFCLMSEGVELARQQIDKAKAELQDDHFRVYDTLYKFSEAWTKKQSFCKCYGMFVTCVIYPDGMIGLCGDRRGDDRFTLCHVNDAFEFWGSDTHKKIVDGVDIGSCSRCSCTHINEMFEQVIVGNNMNCDFI